MARSRSWSSIISRDLRRISGGRDIGGVATVIVLRPPDRLPSSETARSDLPVYSGSQSSYWDSNLPSKAATELPMVGSCRLFTHLQLHQMLSAELSGSRSCRGRYVGQRC